MLVLFLSAVIIANGGGAQLSEFEICAGDKIDECLKHPPIPVGFPTTKEELEARCQVYYTIQSCTDEWINKCAPPDRQKELQRKTAATEAFMRFLCANDTHIRKEYLKEIKCWSRMTPLWNSCQNIFNEDLRVIKKRRQEIKYVDENAEKCCAREMFIICVTNAGRTCSNTAGKLLHHIACILSQDEVDCSQHSLAYCAASTLTITAPLLTTLGFVLYPPWI